MNNEDVFTKNDFAASMEARKMRVIIDDFRREDIKLNQGLTERVKLLNQEVSLLKEGASKIKGSFTQASLISVGLFFFIIGLLVGAGLSN